MNVPLNLEFPFVLKFTPENEAVVREILAVEGQIKPAESLLLYELASRVENGCIVEIGSFRGRSTTALSFGSRKNKRIPVYAIDPQEEFIGVNGGMFGANDRREFFKNISKNDLTDIVRLINLQSWVVAKCWEKPISFLWIDGDHTYEGVRKDFDGFASHVQVGGAIVFHDSTKETLGPYQVIQEELKTEKYKMAGQVELTTLLIKVAE